MKCQTPGILGVDWALVRLLWDPRSAAIYVKSAYKRQAINPALCCQFIGLKGWFNFFSNAGRVSTLICQMPNKERPIGEDRERQKLSIIPLHFSVLQLKDRSE